MKKQSWILAPDIGQCQAKSELCQTEAASQRIQFCGVKLNRIISYRRYSVSIGPSGSNFFYENFDRQFTYTVFIFKTVRCVWVNRSCTNTLLGFFFPACDSFSAILWVARFELKFLFSNLWKLQKP